MNTEKTYNGEIIILCAMVLVAMFILYKVFITPPQEKVAPEPLPIASVENTYPCDNVSDKCI